MKLALFDLDNTLLPIDSDYSWSKFLVGRGVLNQAEYEARNAEFYEQYKAGTLNIYEFLDFQLKPLAVHARSDLNAWRAAFLD
jgi:phosphoserine phosphatase